MNMSSIAGLGNGCPTVPGTNNICNLNGQEISCTLIRECDAQTGTLHYEYALPNGQSPNVNINVANPATQEIIGYQNSNAQFVDTPNVSIASALTSLNPVSRMVTANNAGNEAYNQAIASGQGPVLAAIARNQAISNSLATTPNPTATQAIPSNVPGSYNTHATVPTNNNVNSSNNQNAANQNTNVANTHQAVNNQQGNPATVSTVNTNAGGNSLCSTFQNVSDVLNAGRTWFDGETMGIPNTTVAGGAALILAAIYFGVNKKGR